MLYRHFLYLDVNRIDSLYHQLFPNIDEIQTSISRENKICGKAEIGNIIQGFLPSNFSGEAMRDCNKATTTTAKVSIEEKIVSILDVVPGIENEDLDTRIKGLLVGKVRMKKYKAFLLDTICYFNKIGYSNFEDFFVANYKKDDFQLTWKKAMKEIQKQKYTGNGISIFQLLDEQFMEEKAPLHRFMILNAEYPVIITFSYNKLLLSASEMENYGILNFTRDIHILGIINEIDESLYFIKPFAMWEIFEEEKGDERFWHQVKNFKKHWLDR